MYDKSNQDLEAILHPYMFVLKEGEEIHSNYLDFSLHMLKVSSPEIIPSPGNKRIIRYSPKKMQLRRYQTEEPSTSTNDLPF